MNQKSVRLTSTLTALSALAAAVVAIVAVNSSGLLSAQSTSETKIDLLNVGMCVTTDKTVFKEADCDDGDGGDTFTVGDRDEIVERETVFATYAFDPTQSRDVRAIVTNSDLLKISITDPGRDRRRTVLYPVAGFEGILTVATGGNSPTTVLKRIQDELEDEVDDHDSVTGFDGQDESDTPTVSDGIKVEVIDRDPNTRRAEIGQSGTHTLALYLGGGDADDYPFEPLSVKEDGDGNYVDTVQWYGYVLDDGDNYSGLTDQQRVEQLVNLGSSGASTRTLIADEDRTSGSDDIAPWMVVQANVQPLKKVVIVAVAYETSKREIITGGKVCPLKYSADDASRTGSTVRENDCEPNSAQFDVDENAPNFTRSELSGRGHKLMAKVEGAGDLALNLSLKETAPFSGTYTGFIRLTDADGDGVGPVVRGSDDDDRNDGPLGVRTSGGGFSATRGSQDNWGLQLKDATPATDGDPMANQAAVVGVSDRLTIKYRDSEGDTKEIRVAIDDTPPRIEVTSPEDGSSDDDRSPDFIGEIIDAESGLAEDTFRLYVDNIADGGVGNPGDRRNDTGFVLDIPASAITNTARVTAVSSLTGYGANMPTFGILQGNRDSGSKLYYREDGTTPQASLTVNTAERKIVLADDYDDGDQEAVFDGDARIEGTDKAEETIAGREIEVDFQALVLDLAGNVGFSDADPSKPQIINDLDSETDDRLSTSEDNENGRALNVLGFYSRHVILLDDKDPEFVKDYPAVTGFYGLDSDDDPVPHPRGIMVTFDNEISRETITENTFTVELDDKSDATVEDVIVEENLVFLRLTEDLKTSETPKIGLAAGHRVEDLAGNQLHAREVSEAVEAIDGLPPTLTVTLSGGTGTGEGRESSSGLTKEDIEVTVSSDERLSVAYYAVVCGGFEYPAPSVDGSRSTGSLDVDDFIEARSGALVGGKPSTTAANAKCDKEDMAFTLTERRLRIQNERTNTWRDTWNDPDGLPEGELTVVVYARDVSEYRLDALNLDEGRSQNWSTVTAKFTYDKGLKALVDRNELVVGAGDVIPRPGAKVSENRPHIILRFVDSSTVSLQKMLVDGRDVTARVDSNVKNQFIYVPDELDRGTHKVEVDAIDTAGNEQSFRYEFDVVSRAAFQVRLYAGWNAISLPGEPVDGSLESVFKNSAIDQVISFERKSSDVDPQWEYATRQDGIWTTSYGELTNIKAGLGYWVHADTFVTERVQLRGPDRGRSEAPLNPIGLTTGAGWNFVGVVDQDNDQTEGDRWGDSYTLQVQRRDEDTNQLKTENVAQTADMYLGDYVQAYTWDATRSNFKALEGDSTVNIGDGIWVFYGAGVAP